MRLPQRGAELLVSRRALRGAALAGTAAAFFVTVSLALAAFNSLRNGGPMTITSKHIFPGVRSAAAWNLRDASAGAAEANADDALSYSDAVLKNTANWATTFASNRYLEFDLNGARPAGVPVSSAQFNYRMAPNGAGETACFYFEVYRASTSALIGSHGDASNPVACNSTTTQTTYSTSLAEVTDSDILNDLRVRVYGKESGGKPMKQDLATVTGSTPYASYTAYEKIYRDQADTTLTTTNWGPGIAADNSNYTTAGNWATTFAAARYVKFTPDPAVPAGSVITSASVDFYYRSNTAGDTACWYMETYNGATLLGTHGSSASPISCKTGNTTFSTDNVSLTELTAVADANNLTIKVYMKESGGKKTQIDFVQLKVNYYLD